VLVLAHPILAVCECLLHDTRLCEEACLWGTADSDGTVELRLPTGTPDKHYMLDSMPGKPAHQNVFALIFVISAAGHSCCVRR